jgi:hypothetical protein
VTLSKPLDNFPLVRSANPEVVRATLARVYAEPSLQLGRATKALNARMNECRLPNISLAYGAYGGDVQLDFPAVDCFVQLMVLRGNAKITSRGQSASLVSSEKSATISPDAGYQASYTADYEGLLLKINPQALTKKLAAMTGATIEAPLRMSLQPNGTQSAQVLRQYLPVFAGMLSEAVTPLPAWWVAQTEQLVMVMFLCGHRHAYSHLLEQEAPDSAPWQVRTAEDYIEANWRQAVTLEDLAEVTGVSAFSLFRSFRKSRGCSPLEFASQVRAKRHGRR